MVPPTPLRKKDIPSKDILRWTARRLQQASGGDGGPTGSSITSQQELTKIWGSVGRVIEHSLLAAARGVRIESLGTFTIDGKGRSRFFLAADFAARHRLLKYDACSGGTLAGGAVNSRLNVARVAATAGIPRPEAERVLDAVLRSLHQRLAAGRTVTLSFHPVAEFACSPSGQAAMRFLPSFRAKQSKVAVHATRARAGVAKTKSTPTAWAAPPAAASADATATDTFGRATTPSHARSESVGQSPRSASLRSRRSNVNNRLETPRSNGDGKCSSPQSASGGGDGSSSSMACNSSSTGSTIASAVRRVCTDARKGSARRQPPAQADSIAHRPKTSSSCSSSRDSLGAQAAGRGGKLGIASGRTYNSDDEIPTGAARARGSSECESLQRINSPGVGLGGPHDRQDTEWLSDLLRRQTLAQGGYEGLRRLTETLRLAHVSRESASGVGGDDGGRLSGSDLLLALRDAGTSLTSNELADTTAVFRRQPGGRIPLATLLSGMAPCHRGTPPVQEDTGRHSSTAESGEQVGTPRARAISAVSRDGSSGLPWERPSPRASPAVGGTGAGESSLSSTRLSESSTIEKQIHKAGGRAQGQAAPGRARGNGQQRRGSLSGDKREASGGRRREENGKSGGQAASSALFVVPQQARRECWGDGKDGSVGANGTSGSNATGDAIADLAAIIFHPPSSLEKLIHVLQASKVHEQPTMSCTALSARLTQIRPGLGKVRARELAAAACRYPDKQVDLAQLHALLVRRFGRYGSISSSGNGGDESGGFQRTSSASCAAVARVRRKLLSSSKGLRGLRAALRAVSGGGGGRDGEPGSLTKDELRRALTIAGGADSVPPTTKDVDDLFTLFLSRGASGGVGGGRVETETVLRGLRGEMSPHRERVVRDAFHRLFGRRASTSDSADRGKGVAGNRAGVGGNDPPGTDGDGGYGGWGASPELRTGGDDEIIQALLAGGDGSTRDAPRARAPASPVTFELFLEYYRDVSAGIEGDDEFEARVRSASSSQQYLQPWPAKLKGGGGGGGGGGGATAEVDEQGEAAQVDGARLLRAVEGSSSPLPHQTKTPTDDSGRGRGPDPPAAVPQQRLKLQRFTHDKEKRGSSAGKKGRRCGAENKTRRDHGLSLRKKDGKQQHVEHLQHLQQQQDDRVTIFDSPASAAIPSARGDRQGGLAEPGEPTNPNGRRSSQPLRSSRGADGAGASAPFDRQGAATRVQSLFRGHKGRSHAAAEGRKRARRLAAERAAMEERLRPTAYRRLGGRISRPKGRSTYGF